MSNEVYTLPFSTDYLYPNDRANDSMVSTFGQASGNSVYKLPASQPKFMTPVVIASQVIGASLDTQSNKIKGNFTFSSLGAITIGKITISPEGILTVDSLGANTLTIDAETGSITMVGTLAAGSVVTGYLTVGSAASDVNAGATTISGGKITASSIAADRLSVSTLSAITANLGTVTAGSMSGVDIAIGSSNSIFKADSNGIYLGHATFGSAPFRVTMAGAVTASSLTLTNASIGSGSAYTGNAIDEAYIGNLNASKITAGDISAARIQTNILSAIQAVVSTLSAIVVNAGNIVVGGSADSLGTIVVKNSSNTEIAKLNNSGIIVRNTRGLFFEETTTNQYWDFQVNASNQAVTSLPSTNQFFMTNYAGDTNYFTVSDSQVYSSRDLNSDGNNHFKNLYLNQGQNEGNIGNVDTIQGYNDLNFKLGNNSYWFSFYDASGNEKAKIESNGKFFSDASTIDLGGTEKTAIVRTAKGFNALYCAEAPEVWFFDFCESKDKVDPKFMEVTEGEMKFIMVDGGGYQVWRRRIGHAHKRFEPKTTHQFEVNEKFLKMARG